jgi:hypothetical protein
VGQTVHVTEGVGRIQARGGDVVEIHPGDTVYTPAGEWHWHGAAPDRFMTTSRSGRHRRQAPRPSGASRSQIRNTPRRPRRPSDECPGGRKTVPAMRR